VSESYYAYTIPPTWSEINKDPNDEYDVYIRLENFTTGIVYCSRIDNIIITEESPLSGIAGEGDDCVKISVL